MGKIINLKKWKKLKERLKFQQQKLKLIKILEQFGRYFEIRKK